MIRFGVSGMPPDDVEDAEFLDRLVADERRAYELAFVKDFPWNEERCEAFGAEAAARNIWLSVHAPYFAILTVEDEEKSRQCLAALEHTMKLGRALGSRIICAHFGPIGDREPEVLMDVIRRRLESIAPKVAHLGVGLGLETAGNDRSIDCVLEQATNLDRRPQGSGPGTGLQHRVVGVILQGYGQGAHGLQRIFCGGNVLAPDAQ